MSGLVILVPIALGTGGLAVSAICGSVARTVKNLVDHQIEIAEKAAAVEREKIAKWQAWQKNQRQQFAVLAENHAALLVTQGKLMAVGLTMGRADQIEKFSTAQGYSSLKIKPNSATPQESTAWLQDIVHILNEAPADFRNAPDSPYQRLQAHAERLSQRLISNNLPSSEEVSSFQEAIALTISGHVDTARKKQESIESKINSLNNLLQSIGRCRQLASSPERQTTLDGLQAQTLGLLEKPSISMGQVELLEKRLAVIWSALETQVTQSAFRTTLATSLGRHLKAMGFMASESFPPLDDKPVLTTVMDSPDGARLRIAIQTDNRLAFEVLPKKEVEKQRLSASDRERYRAQEKNWCQKEMPELLRRLTQEGFSYEVQLARDLPDSRLQVAVVEDAKEILASQAKAANLKKKPVTTPQPDTHAEEVRRHHLQQQKRGERH
ncbi:MAG: hypothetical protein J0665_04410 [Deltaproteobacteria bacterium]|nr:hypothetical protein [Deltaproteobacteria bacterium]